MGIINKFTKRCIFCHSKEGTVYVPAFEIYNWDGAGNWYHKSCLLEIVCAPEKHPSRSVDMANDIVDRIETRNTREKAKQERTTKQWEHLKQQCTQLSVE